MLNGIWGASPSWGLGREPQPGSGAGAPAGCGAEPRDKKIDDFRAQNSYFLALKLSVVYI